MPGTWRPAQKEKTISTSIKEEHFGHEPGNLLIEFPEFFQLFQGDALDKTLVTAYCL